MTDSKANTELATAFETDNVEQPSTTRVPKVKKTNRPKLKVVVSSTGETTEYVAPGYATWDSRSDAWSKVEGGDYVGYDILFQCEQYVDVETRKSAINEFVEDHPLQDCLVYVDGVARPVSYVKTPKLPRKYCGMTARDWFISLTSGILVGFLLCAAIDYCSTKPTALNHPINVKAKPYHNILMSPNGKHTLWVGGNGQLVVSSPELDGKPGRVPPFTFDTYHEMDTLLRLRTECAYEIQSKVVSGTEHDRLVLSVCAETECVEVSEGRVDSRTDIWVAITSEGRMVTSSGYLMTNGQKSQLSGGGDRSTGTKGKSADVPAVVVPSKARVVKLTHPFEITVETFTPILSNEKSSMWLGHAGQIVVSDAAKKKFTVDTYPILGRFAELSQSPPGSFTIRSRLGISNKDRTLQIYVCDIYRCLGLMEGTFDRASDAYVMISPSGKLVTGSGSEMKVGIVGVEEKF